MMRPIGFLAMILLAAPAMAQAQGETDKGGETKFEQKAEDVLRQPLKDFGILREEAPAVLAEAVRAPYALSGLRNCGDFSRAIAQLDSILGPDVDAVDARGEPLPGRLAEAGARSVFSSLIPFRGLVREATGAAEADRRLRQALAAGMARRGFLKGTARARGCRV